VSSSPQLTGSGAPTGPRTPPTGPVEHHQRLITAPKPTATTKITSHDHAYNRLTAAGSDHTGPHRHPFNTSHLGEPSDEAARQVELCNDNLCALATNFADAGFTPVIDTVVPNQAQLDVFRRALGDRLRLLVLDPGTDACVERNATRPAIEQFFFDGYPELHASMLAGFGDLGWWLDTSELTAERTVERVLAEAYERAQG